MQISLLPEEVNYIYSLVSKDIKQSNWVRTHILTKIEAGWNEQDHRANCQHERGLYIGKKTCCVKCGGYFEEGQGEEWELIRSQKEEK